jgi:hypothetical protein
VLIASGGVASLDHGHIGKSAIGDVGEILRDRHHIFGVWSDIVSEHGEIGNRAAVVIIAYVDLPREAIFIQQLKNSLTG